MGAIAEAAGLSRPALYLHFANREDVFHSALADVLERANERALAALDDDRPLAERLDTYLQRCRGDTLGPLLGSAHGAEIVDARHATADHVAEPLHESRRRKLESHLRDRTDPTSAKRAIELLELAPLGLLKDQPTPRAFRTRLTALATAAALLIESAPTT